MKVRIKFAKSGFSQFLGHLDIMRYFQKLNRRADIDVCYSVGYSPHQIMSFAAPLGLGQTSEGEYVDMEVHSFNFASSEEAVNHINQFAAEGISLVDCCILPDDADNAMASVRACRYSVTERENVSESRKAAFVKLFDQPDLIARFFAQPGIVVLKKTKKSEAETDIRPLIYEWQFDADARRLEMFVSAGSACNLKPELVLQALYEFAGYEFDPMQYVVHRIDMYTVKGDESSEFCSLLDVGERLHGAE